MGLDMYLRGTKFLRRNWNDPAADRKEDGFRVAEIILDVGYWRKHPNLHGFIVQTFANGEDECQRIDLSAGDLRKILEASENDQLPQTNGFFFGQSVPKDKIDTKKILTDAIAWLEDDPTHTKSVYYQASW